LGFEEKNVRKYPILICILSGLAACSDQDSRETLNQQAQARQVSVMRNQDAAQIQRGRKLFVQNCATCHGNDAQGAPNWSQADAKGKYPPPPLNGTGHAWHHPKRALMTTIKYGTARLGGSMPAWQGRLSEQDINDIIAWFQSQWPDEIYAAWQRMDQAPQQSNR
jgi:mono/diheme cytochrome c family protein